MFHVNTPFYIQIELKEMQPKLMATQKEVVAMMEQIIIDKQDADVTRIEVEKQQESAAATAVRKGQIYYY